MIILLAIGGYFVFLKEKPTYKKALHSTPQISAVYNKNPEKDTDNDGLKDWEEILWKTDINNPDTDGDGTNDGDEIDQNRDPLKKGPDDILSPTDKTDLENRKPETLTNIVSQQILGEVLKNKQTNTLDTNQLANSVVEMLDDFSETPDVYNLSDLNISPENDTDEIKKYGNELGLIIKKHFDPIAESELTVLAKAAQAQNESEIKELEKIALAYKNVSEEVLELKVPSNLTENHLAIVNSFSKISDEINKMKKGFVDPMMVLIGLKQYQTTSETAHGALKNMNSYFSDKNITFENKEITQLFAFYQ